MKKVILLPVLLLGLSLASCGSSDSKKSDFKDRSYADILSDEEAAQVLERAAVKLNSVSSIIEKSSEIVDQEHNKIEETKEVKHIYHSEGSYRSTEKVTYKQSVEGISYEHKEENAYDTFYGTKKVDSVDKYYRMGYALEDKIEGASGTEISKAAYEAIAYNAYSQAKNKLDVDSFHQPVKAYKLKNGSYEFITSSFNEYHVGEDWGVGVKERITITKEQKVLTINKDGKITKMEDTEEQQTNRDPGTQNWYSSVKLVSKETSSYEVKYDAKESEASRVNELSSKMAGALTGELAFAVALFDVSGEAASPVGTIPTSLTYCIKENLQTFKVGYSFESSAMGGHNGVSFAVGGSVLDAIPGAGKAADQKFAPTASVANWSNKTINDVPMLVMGENAQAVNGLLEFTVVSSVAGLAVSDVTLTLR